MDPNPLDFIGRISGLQRRAVSFYQGEGSYRTDTSNFPRSRIPNLLENVEFRKAWKNVYQEIYL